MWRSMQNRSKMAIDTTQASEFSNYFFKIFDVSGSKDDFEKFSLENLEQEVTRPATNDLLIKNWTAGDQGKTD